MAEARPPLAPSLSFAGSPSNSIIGRPLKRSLSAAEDSGIFAPAAISFNPRPYIPSCSSNLNTITSRRPSHASASQRRTLETLQHTHNIMDPHRDDPSVLFIHPPFKDFPGSHLYPDGLTYSLLAEKPDWFLDADDFIALDSDTRTGVPYPSSLEPPRGWCPAKKRDLKERGSEGWPEGEEPRLRCTFCRRTYAGVNAKSMWRRHVFEKHKIAMANRRDTGDKPRGRRSTSTHFSAHTTFVTNRFLEENKPVFVEGKTQGRDSSESPSRAQVARGHLQPQQSHNPMADTHCLSEDDFPASPTSQTPEPMPKPELSTGTQGDMSSNVSLAQLPTIPPSPYDPTQTPTFRHSHPYQPHDHPWRFPSPTHPLHSRQRDLSLSLLAGPTGTPLRPSKSSPTVDSRRTCTLNEQVSRSSPQIILNQPENLALTSLSSSPFSFSSPVTSTFNLESWLRDEMQFPLSGDDITECHPLASVSMDAYDISSSLRQPSERSSTQVEDWVLLEPFDDSQKSLTSLAVSETPATCEIKQPTDLLDLGLQFTPPKKRRRTTASIS
jgi:hypothetical protein